MSRGRGYVPRGLGSFSSPNRGRGSISSLSHLGSLSGFSRGGFGAGRGGGGNFSTGPPDQVFEMGSFLHASEGDMLYESTNPKIPYFNAPIFLENKSVIGKVDEILGPMNQVYFTVKPAEGIVATSFKKGDKVFIGGDKLLPLERFLPKPKGATVKRPGGRGGAGGRGGDRGRGRGGFSRGGRGGSFGSSRGGGRSFSAGGRGTGGGGGRGGSFRGRGRGSY